MEKAVASMNCRAVKIAPFGDYSENVSFIQLVPLVIQALPNLPLSLPSPRVTSGWWLFKKAALTPVEHPGS